MSHRSAVYGFTLWPILIAGHAARWYGWKGDDGNNAQDAECTSRANADDMGKSAPATQVGPFCVSGSAMADADQESTLSDRLMNRESTAITAIHCSYEN
jgi:hypothetical protein